MRRALCRDLTRTLEASKPFLCRRRQLLIRGETMLRSNLINDRQQRLPKLRRCRKRRPVIEPAQLLTYIRQRAELPRASETPEIVRRRWQLDPRRQER